MSTVEVAAGGEGLARLKPLLGRSRQPDVALFTKLSGLGARKLCIKANQAKDKADYLGDFGRGGGLSAGIYTKSYSSVKKE